MNESNNILIIFTHPNHNSLNYSMYLKVLDGLNSNPIKPQFKTLDLYEVGFNPSLVFNEEKKRRNMYLEEDTKAYRDLIHWANHLVFIYPIWWGRPPAMLLGFFDRVFTKDFAYVYKSKYLTEGLLGNKKVTCISTMKGPNGYITLLLNNAHKVLMKRAIFNFVGIKQTKFFEFGNMELNNKARLKALEKVHGYFMQIE